MRVQPYALLGASVVNTVADCVKEAVDAWRADWGFGDLPVDVECGRAWEASSQHRSVQWQRSYAAAGKGAWIAWQSDFARFLQRQIFPSDQRHLMQSQSAPSIAAETAEQAVLALADRIARAVFLPPNACNGVDTSAPNENTFAIASGALLARIKMGEQMVSCLLDHDCVRAVTASTLPRQKEPIQRAGVNRTLGKIPVNLAIEIGQVEIDVGSLLTLAVGDVVRLNASVDKPLTVYGPGGSGQKALFDAYLGTLEGRIAVEVVRRGDLHI